MTNIVAFADQKGNAGKYRSFLEFPMPLNRAVEFILALIMIVPVIAVSLVLMALIRFDTPGLPLVFQKRVGRDERVFTCLKLRTFIIGSEIVATHEAQSNQITPLGRWLRPLHLDELPQIFNVLTGDMSFVRSEERRVGKEC